MWLAREVPMSVRKIARAFDVCYQKLGGDTNGHIRWVLHDRPKDVSRKTFFTEAVWAIMGSGIRWKSNDAFCKRATEVGFPWDFVEIANWPQRKWDGFFSRLYPYGVSGRGGMKWAAVQSIARELFDLPDEAAFRADFFGGKKRSADLNSEDVGRLRRRKLPFIGPANAQFVVRNMGGESLKCDRWILAFLDYLGVNAPALEEELARLRISLSLFDIALWAYCEQFVRQVANFRGHFNQLLS
jgi:hypothetical protein